MKLLSVGDQIERGSYTVHSRFRRAVNFSNGRHLVFLVSQEIGAGPLNIVLAGAGSQEALACVSGVRAEENFLQLDEQHFELGFGDRYDSKLALRTRNTNCFAQNLEQFRRLLAETSPARSLAFLIAPERIGSFTSSIERAFISRIQCGVDEFFGGNLLEGVSLLKGCGMGLTPSGDDFIAGVLVGLQVVQLLHERELGEAIDTIFRAAAGDNIFSKTFLDLARRGLVSEKQQNLILALSDEHPDALRGAALNLFAVGATSGADFGTGFLMTLLEENGAVARWNGEVGEAAKVNQLRDRSARKIRAYGAI